ncbi:alpha/beta hydrolase [Litorimonas haliclonae]|uniref:alpha/beta hydrolase n=1 Tax=Litorimonas haliclonae TaxID=2081977 RepID=UPI0039F01A70
MTANQTKSLIRKDLDHVDEELRPALDHFPEFKLNLEGLSVLRAFPPSDPLRDPPYKETIIHHPERGDGLRMLIIDPGTTGKPRPALLYLHGGGFVFGSPEQILPTMQKLAADVGCVICLPAYRLAPENTFPAPLEDNYLALSWMFENAKALGIDTDRIAVGGDSAGGGHAANLAIAARDRQFYPISFQLLLYPMLDDRTGSSRPVPDKVGEFIWTVESNKFGWSSYLGCPAGGPNVPSQAVPARRQDLTKLPPTLIATGSLDLFCEENSRFADRLDQNGVDVDLQIFSGAYHGFNVMVPEAKISKRFHQCCVEGLKEGLKAKQN